MIYDSPNDKFLSSRKSTENLLFWRKSGDPSDCCIELGLLTGKRTNDFNSLSAFKLTIKIIDFTTFLKCCWYFLTVHRRVTSDCSICTLVSWVLLDFMINTYNFTFVHCNVYSVVLILWYHVSGGVILPRDHLKHVSSIVFMTLAYCTANLSLNIK